MFFAVRYSILVNRVYMGKMRAVGTQYSFLGVYICTLRHNKLTTCFFTHITPLRDICHDFNLSN